MLIAPVIVYKEKKKENVSIVNHPWTLEALTNIASRMFFLISSIFCLRSVSENPFTCNIRICFTIVDLPDSPAPSKSNLCVAR